MKHKEKDQRETTNDATKKILAFLISDGDADLETRALSFKQCFKRYFSTDQFVDSVSLIPDVQNAKKNHTEELLKQYEDEYQKEKKRNKKESDMARMLADHSHSMRRQSAYEALVALNATDYEHIMVQLFDECLSQTNALLSIIDAPVALRHLDETIEIDVDVKPTEADDLLKRRENRHAYLNKTLSR